MKKALKVNQQIGKTNNKLRNMYSTHKEEIKRTTRQFEWCVTNFFGNIFSVLRNLLIAGLIFGVIAHFVPELREKAPTIFGFYDLGLQVVEKIIRMAFEGFTAIFEGKTLQEISAQILKPEMTMLWEAIKAFFMSV